MTTLLPFLVILVLILINGLFVAAEFAIIGVRATRIEQLANEGNRAARWVQHVLHSRANMDHYIATSQLGVTLASLGLGMYGEPHVTELILEPLQTYLGLESGLIHTVAFIVALSLITYLHVVIGEMVPKSMALQNAERTVLLLTGPMNVMSRIFSVPVALLNRFGALLLRIMHIPPPEEESRQYTTEELELIISESYASGLLDESEQQLVVNIFDFSERRAGQVMTPRIHIEAIPIEITETELLQFIRTAQHTRLPVYQGTLDHILGVLHIKDLVRQHLSGQPFDLRALLRQVPFVPETLMVDTLMTSFRKQHVHMAIVVDEHGGTQGLVTLEDLVEEVVGEVQDEFDIEAAPLTLVSPGHLVAQGAVLLDDLQEYVALDAHGHDVQTIAGLVMAELGEPAKPGDEVTLDHIRLRVDAVEGLAIERVSIFYSDQLSERQAQGPAKPSS